MDEADNKLCTILPFLQTITMAAMPIYAEVYSDRKQL